MRTFVAIKMGDAVKSKLIPLLERLRRAEKGVKWVGPEGLHFTLKFLGEVDGERLPEVESVLASAARDAKTFTLACTGTGTFPPASRSARVIWAGIVPEPSLMRLQARLEDDLEVLDFPKERRPFHPHVTLGRVKHPSGLGNRGSQILEKERETFFGETVVEKVTFFRSELKPTGAVYTTISEFEIP